MKNSHIFVLVVAALLIAGLTDWYVFLNRDSNEVKEATALERAENIATDWIEKESPTYLFDGSELVLKEAKEGECQECFELVFSFSSNHGGYGNREGLFVTEVITPHTVAITVENGEVLRAITDKKYDEKTGALGE